MNHCVHVSSVLTVRVLQLTSLSDGWEQCLFHCHRDLWFNWYLKTSTGSSSERHVTYISKTKFCGIIVFATSQTLISWNNSHWVKHKKFQDMEKKKISNFHLCVITHIVRKKKRRQTFVRKCCKTTNFQKCPECYFHLMWMQPKLSTTNQGASEECHHSTSTTEYHYLLPIMHPRLTGPTK